LEIQLLAIGRAMPDWIEAGWNEYRRRLPKHLKLELVELAPARAEQADQRRTREGEALQARASADAIWIALDPGGAPWSTETLARKLNGWTFEGRPVALFVGGADGHGEALLRRCRQRWSLGPLTFPHMLVRVVIAEQLYRAWTILDGHPYHRG